jgi:hypothetical protein
MVMARKDSNGEWTVGAELPVDRYNFEGTVESIKANLDRVREEAVALGMTSEGYVDISVSRGYYGDDYDMEIVYRFNRTETAGERARREELERYDREAAKAKRRAAAEKKRLKADPEFAEFERLKAKFGG